jgi:hypothetical protein
VRANLALYVGLTGIYKQLNAPFGEFARASEKISTKAVQTTAPGDAVYNAWDGQLRGCGEVRNAVADAIKVLLDRASFAGAALDAGRAMKLIDASTGLIDQIKALASDSAPPATPACHV